MSYLSGTGRGSGRETPIAAGARWKYILLPAVVMMGLFFSHGLCDLSGDSARYLLLGRGLGQGLGYVEMEKPGAPPHTEYGPGLPLLLAPFARTAPSLLVAGKALMGVSLIMCWLFFFHLLRAAVPDLPRSTAHFLTAVLALMPNFYRFANQVLSDLPYAAASLGALYYFYTLMNREKGPAGRSWFFAGLVMSLAFFFRQVGIALWPACVLGLILDRPRRGRARAALLLSAGFLIPVLAWLLRNYLVAGALDPSHWHKLFMAREADPFSGNIGAAGLLARTLRGFIAYFQETPTVLLDMAWPLVPRWLRLVVAAVAAAPVLYGFAMRFFQKRGALEWYFIFYFLIICAWQSHYPRYLVPLVPVALVFAASGGGGLLGPEGAADGPVAGAARRNRIIILVSLGAALVFNLVVLGRDLSIIRHSPTTPPLAQAGGEFESPEGKMVHDLAGDIKWGYWYQYPDWLDKSDPAAIAMSYHRLIAASVWMGKNLPGAALVLARKPRLSYWYSGVSTIQYPPTPEPAAFARFLRQRGVTHLLVDETTPVVRMAVRNFIKERPGVLVPVFTLGGTSVLEVKNVKDEG